MNSNRKERNRIFNRFNVFLFELILDLALFAFLLCVCLQLISKAHMLTRKTDMLYRAVNVCENIADLYESGNGDYESISQNYTNSISTGDHIFLYYDYDFQETNSENATYIISCKEADPDTIAFHGNVLEIRCMDQKMNEVYSIRACRFESLASTEGRMQK